MVMGYYFLLTLKDMYMLGKVADLLPLVIIFDLQTLFLF